MTQPIAQELTLRDLLQSLSRRRSVLFWSVGICFLLGVLACLLTTKQYQATATVELQSPMANGLDRRTLMGDAPVASDSLAADIDLQTQAKILQSDTLALRTIESLHLGGGSKVGRFSGIWPFTRWVNTVSPQDSVRATSAALAGFRHHLTVKTISGTRLIEVSYLDPNPEVAAAVVDDLIKQLIEFSQQTSTQATDESARALSKELEGLRSQSQDLQKRVAAMQATTGMYDEGTTDAQGREQAYSDILEQFRRASAVLSDATQNHILKDAIAHVARTGNAELISSLAGNTSTGAASSSVTNSLGTIQNLRVSEGQMKTQLDQLRVKFGPGYPKVAELQAGIAGIEQSIHDETERIRQRAESDADVANRTLRDAQQNYDRLKEQADAMNNRTIDYRLTKQEADESRTLYSDLLKRLKEAGILQGLQSNTVSVVDAARVPQSPAKPAVMLYLAASIAAGVVLGLFGIAVVELLDDSVADLGTVEGMGYRLIGILPRLPLARGVAVDDAELGPYHEAVRSVRVQLMRSRMEAGAALIVVAPLTPEESVLPFVASMTEGAAKAGHRVLLVTADWEGAESMHASSPNEIIGEKGGSLARFHIAPAGAGDSVEAMLEAGRMQGLVAGWRGEFDLIVMEAPSILFQPDTVILSQMADMTVQVARYGVTTKTALRRTAGTLREYAGKRFVLVLDGVPVTSASYRNYYGASARPLKVTA